MGTSKPRVLILYQKRQRYAALISNLRKRGFDVLGMTDSDAIYGSGAKVDVDCALVGLDTEASLKSIKKIRNATGKGKELPVVAMYGRSQSGMRARAIQCGADTILRWPTDILSAESLMHTLLQRKRRHEKVLKEAEELKREHGTLMQKLSEIEDDLDFARKLQRSMLPRTFPRIPGTRFSCRYLSSTKMSGDFYDIFRLDEKHVGFYVADVMGHGVAASLLTVFIKKGIKTKQISGNSYWIIPPHNVLDNLNRDIISQQFSKSPFITMSYCIYNHETRLLSFACAGHPSPILFRERHVRPLEDTKGALLGIFENEYTSQEVTLQPGDRLLLFTDGVDYIQDAEGNRGALAFFNILEKVKDKPIEQCLEAITQSLIPAGKESTLKDDISLFGLEVY